MTAFYLLYKTDDFTASLSSKIFQITMAKSKSSLSHNPTSSEIQTEKIVEEIEMILILKISFYFHQTTV